MGKAGSSILNQSGLDFMKGTPTGITGGGQVVGGSNTSPSKTGAGGGGGALSNNDFATNTSKLVLLNAGQNTNSNSGDLYNDTTVTGRSNAGYRASSVTGRNEEPS